MSQYWFAALGTPLILGLAGLFVYLTTSHMDRRDRERAKKAGL